MNLQEFFNSGAFVRIEEDQWVLSWGEQTELARPVESQVCYYVSDFFKKSNTPWIIFANNTTLTTFELQKLLEFTKNPQMRSVAEIKNLAQISLNKPHRVVQWEWIPANKQQFEVEFNDIQNSIKNKQFQKVVPLTYEEAKAQITKDQLKNILHRLLSCGEGLYPYGFWKNSQGLIGATPEVLMSFKNQTLTSMALAGTRSAASSTNLLKEPKEVFEHQLVVEDLKSKLAQFGKVESSDTKEYNIGTLVHLKTDVSVAVKNKISIEEVIDLLHPTPALGGVPQEKALQWLKDEAASQVRKYYGAPFGIQIANGDYLILVAIRNIQWEENGIKLFSGCGIVEKSELEAEWQELFNKRTSVKNVLGV